MRIKIIISVTTVWLREKCSELYIHIQMLIETAV